MASRTALITILLIFFSEGSVRAAVSWEDGTCKISLPEPTTTGDLYEFTAPGGTNTGYTYTVDEQSVDDQFAINNDGTLSSATALEFEGSKNPYSVDIIATFTGDATKNGKVTCTIQVVRLNFVPNSYSVDTVNNVAVGTSILTVLATYAGVSSESYTVEYDIKDATDENFEIVTGTGEISAKRILTAEEKPELVLTVIATDSVDKTFTAEAEVTVCVGCKRSGSSTPGFSFFASMSLVLSILLM